jgi:hydrogenase/urease accessory protein HupE
MPYWLSSKFPRLCVNCLLGLVWMAPFSVSAHVVEVGHGSVNLVANQAYVAMSIPASTFASADDNGDGWLDAVEIKAHQEQLLSKVQKGLRLWGDGHRAVWQHLVLSPVTRDTSKPESLAPQVAVIGLAAWDTAPSVVVLEHDLWQAPSDKALIQPGAPLETLKLSVTRSQDGQVVAEEVGLLSPLQPKLEFFAPVQRHIANFAHHGFDHIMGGADHLVFLVALLASGISVRRWAALLTAFTLAHGLTFGLASMGWVTVSASLVEPAIAASIVCVAALHLMRVHVALRTELLLVLALGLVHGLGFASAMQEEGGSQLIALSPYPLWSILGFNLGIEAGQGAVALVLGLWVWGVRRILGRSKDVLWQRAAGMGALAIGAFWLMERIVSLLS